MNIAPAPTNHRPNDGDQPLHVVHVVQSFQTGGLERMVETIVRLSLNQSVQSTVIAYESNGPMREAFERAGARAVFLRKGPGIDAAFARELTHAVAAARPDVVHSHHVGPFFYSAPAARWAGSGHVHTEHSVEAYDAPRRRMIGRLMPSFAHVFAVSREVAEARRALFGGETPVIDNGVAEVPAVTPEERARVRAATGLPAHAFLIGVVARLAPEKDHITLLRAVRTLHAHNLPAHLVIVGDGPVRGELEAAAREMGLQSHAHFLGMRSDAATLNAAFDVAALTSLREGQPLALLEAMARGVPVVATGVGGVPELLADGAGTIVPIRDEQATSAALYPMLLDPVLRARAAAAGRARIRRHHSAGAMVNAYTAAYRAAAPGGRP